MISRLARTHLPFVGCVARYSASFVSKCSSPGTRTSSIRSNVTVSVAVFFPNLTSGEVPSRATNGTGCDSRYLGTPCASGGDVTSRRHPPFAGSSSTTALTSLADVTPGSLTRMTYDPLRSALAVTSGVDMASDSPHVRCGCAERRDGVVSNSLKISARSRRDDHSFGSRREAGGRYGVVSAR